MFSSTIQVLKVENEERTSKKTGDKYTHFAARCILLDDDGGVVTVGLLSSRRMAPELREQVKVGTYRATFAIQVPDYGMDKGEMVSMLTGLVPFPQRGDKPAPAASASAPK